MNQGPARRSPTRRVFTRLLAAGTGLAALAACSPSPVPQPTATAVADPSLTTSKGTTTSGPPSAIPSPAGASPDVTSAGGAPSAASEPSGLATVPVRPAQAAPPSSSLAVQHSLDDPASPWVVVNKHRPLVPAQYVPAGLVRPAVALAVGGEASLLNSATAAAAEQLFAAAARAGAPMALASGYRSYVTQVATYAGYVSARGQASADTASARPGFSEHQTGWAFDIADGGGACSFLPCFADQPSAVWVKAHAHEFGFVVRYPWMLHDITGYYYEPWHLRYVGVEAATDMHARGILTLEEYFGTGAAPTYP